MAVGEGIEPSKTSLYKGSDTKQVSVFTNFTTPQLIHYMSPARFIPEINLVIPIPPPYLGLNGCDKNS